MTARNCGLGLLLRLLRAAALVFFILQLLRAAALVFFILLATHGGVP
jgi:hypothetical protein